MGARIEVYGQENIYVHGVDGLHGTRHTVMPDNLEAITYLRGRNLVDKFVIVDEVSNITPKQVKTILSRIGKGSKIVFLGDINQIDNPYLDKTSNGLVYLINRLNHKKEFAWIELKNTYRSKIAKMAELL